MVSKAIRLTSSIDYSENRCLTAFGLGVATTDRLSSSGPAATTMMTTSITTAAAVVVALARMPGRLASALDESALCKREGCEAEEQSLEVHLVCRVVSVNSQQVW